MRRALALGGLAPLPEPDKKDQLFRRRPPAKKSKVKGSKSPAIYFYGASMVNYHHYAWPDFTSDIT